MLHFTTKAGVGSGMTTGSDIVDNRRTVNGVANIGTYWNKSWNGTNAPKVNPSPISIPRSVKRSRSRGEHAYTMALTSYNNALMRWFPPSGSPYWSSAGASAPFPGDNGWTANDDISLVGQLKSQVQGSDFDMSIFLGTSHQTLRMIGDNALSIAKALRAARKGDMTGAAKALGSNRRGIKNRPATNVSDTLSSRWLELQYGWMPLLKDIDEGAHFIAHQLHAPMVQRYRVSRKKDAIPPVSQNGFRNQSGYKRVSIIAIMKENPSLIPSLGLMDPENLAWELLPWSFVIDWMYPIGDYLSARSFAQKLSGTFVTSTKIQMLASNYQIGQPGWSATGGESAFHKKVSFTRAISSSLSIPTPAVKSLDRVASWAHCKNALALATQQVLGLKSQLR